jgi:hypothetical protein
MIDPTLSRQFKMDSVKPLASQTQKVTPSGKLLGYYTYDFVALVTILPKYQGDIMSAKSKGV